MAVAARTFRLDLALHEFGLGSSRVIATPAVKAMPFGHESVSLNPRIQLEAGLEVHGMR